MAQSTTGVAVDPELPQTLQAPSPVERRRLRRLVLGSAGLLALLAAWEGLTWIIAYTDDAYVQSDLVAVAPQRVWQAWPRPSAGMTPITCFPAVV